MSIHNQLAPTPPMGWNSYDCYGTSVTEAEVKANADYMAQNLRHTGWNYIVIDGMWYASGDKDGQAVADHAAFAIDDYGRWLPALDRFPSAADGVGFKALADYIHSKGLLFGIHLMRGIPRRAVAANLPIFGTDFLAQEITDTTSTCTWCDHNYGINMNHPGAQSYYDSVVALAATWGVDYIKADDMAAPYYADEIAAIAQAITVSSRDIVLSLSPGDMAPSFHHADHLLAHCELWRISPDLWDQWIDAPRSYPLGCLKDQFARCREWATYAGPGHWLDADMLPLGRLGPRPAVGVDRQTALTSDEQVTLMTLWAIARSPLMFGGDLPSLDTWTSALLTNEEVLAVNQHSINNRELFWRDQHIGWCANPPASPDVYLALFNLDDEPTTMVVPLGEIGYRDGCQVRDLWEHKELTVPGEYLTQTLPPHGAFLCRIMPITS